ncbi:MAG: acetylxylan esterase [Sediminicola sp.]
MKFKHVLILAGIFVGANAFSQKEVNYKESAVGPYILPELLTLNNGNKILNKKEWETSRRPEIIDFYKNEVYGVLPAMELPPISSKIVEQNTSALNNTAIRQQIQIIFGGHGRQLTINVLLYLPKGVAFPPVFIGYNFYGNQSVIDDSNILLSDAWVNNNESYGITENKTNDRSRGKRNYRWPINEIIGEGYGIATIYYGDIDPDRNNFSDGVHPLFYTGDQTRPKDNEWGSLSAWAWGLSRVMDYFEGHGPIDQSKFIVFGHSRLGKTSLWAGALDDRFDMVISNNSGCGGAALFRRNYGETLSIVNQNFPHWFATNFKKYNDNENLLQVDQHMLIALMAPRPVYIASAEDDKWSDPKGEYLSGFYATPVYELYGKSGLTSQKLPETNRPVHTSIGYHIRTGKHDVTDYDWNQFIKFADIHLKE